MNKILIAVVAVLGCFLLALPFLKKSDDVLPVNNTIDFSKEQVSEPLVSKVEPLVAPVVSQPIKSLEPTQSVQSTQQPIVVQQESGFDMGDAAIGYLVGNALLGGNDRDTVVEKHYYERPRAEPVKVKKVKKYKPKKKIKKLKIKKRRLFGSSKKKRGFGWGKRRR